jgi:DNA-binding MarR family transcriptional regulator/CheY-like chemotaxis protein
MKSSFVDRSTDATALNQADDEILFAEEIESSQVEQSWKILIVDDDGEVHNVTRLALNDYVFEGQSLTFISAYSAQEAKQLIQAHPDTAIIFVDVVMETDDAGLQIVKYLREELDNQLVRVVLRTGQPGRAPEDVVVMNYGIDDYKTKTELTSQKLSSTVTTALRAFSTLMKMLKIVRDMDSRIVQLQQAQIVADASNARQCQSNSSDQFLPLPQNQIQPVQHGKLETLSRLVVEISDGLDHAACQADSLSTMSVITRIAKMVLRATDEHFAKLGISQTKLAALIYLSGEPDLCASPSALASHCDVSRAAMTGLLDGLEQEGFVERDGHPFDRRALMIRLTPKGQQFLDWIIPQDQYRLPELMSVLNDIERQKLIELANKVLELSKHCQRNEI